MASKSGSPTLSDTHDIGARAGQAPEITSDECESYGMLTNWPDWPCSQPVTMGVGWQTPLALWEDVHVDSGSASQQNFPLQLLPAAPCLQAGHQPAPRWTSRGPVQLEPVDEAPDPRQLPLPRLPSMAARGPSLPPPVPLPDTAELRAPASASTATGLLPSIGSASHAGGACKPCAYFLHGVCEEDERCQFCHFPHAKKGSKRARPPKSVRTKLKQALSAEAVAVVSRQSWCAQADATDGPPTVPDRMTWGREVYQV